MPLLTVEKPATIKSSKAPGNPDFWVNAGETFEIKLKEDTPAGNVWALVDLPEDFYLLDDRLDFEQPNPPGPGGVRHFTFVGMKPRTEGTFVFYELKVGTFVPIADSIWLVKVK